MIVLKNFIEQYEKTKNNFEKAVEFLIHEKEDSHS